MFRKVVLVLILVTLLSQFNVSTAFAAGTCPPGFHIEPAMHHDHEHEHQHVGTSADKNGDESICVKHITPDGSIHVHVDNNLR